MTLAELEDAFMLHILKAVAAQSPYVWCGKGDRLWSPSGPVPNPFGRDVFDCSGLITTCLLRAGGPDLTLTHGAKQLREACPAFDLSSNDRLRLRFYPGHVALHLRIRDQTDDERADSRATLIEAAGGDENTLAPTARGHVRRGHDLRGSFLCEGSLSALVRQLMPELL